MQIAVILPWAQSTAVLPTLKTIRAQMQDCQRLWPQLRCDYWLIDDGVSEAVQSELRQAQARWPECHLLTLSRHFGYTGAVQAGLVTATADAYLVLDHRYPEQFAAIPQMLAAVIDAGSALVGFVSAQPRHWWQKKPAMTFHDCLLTMPVKRAWLQAAARAGFSFDLLAEIGFKQKMLAWVGSWPATPATPRWPLVVAVGVVAVCCWWWPSAVALNVVLSGVVFWQWQHQQRRPPRVSYVVSSIQR
ncbi:MAG: glycosyltransferase [Lactobacillus sp.]|jgi:hypothetical protein|nr:glycosyltransferase [Lactobacillus sp.]MCI2032981.1 glycosyltransferase [Lactobacillus sp.]